MDRKEDQFGNQGMKYRLTESFTFEAAHKIRKSKEEYGQLHGHSHQVFVTIVGEPHPTFGWILEQSAFRSIVELYIQQLDHSFLNDKLTWVTAEGIANWLFRNLRGDFPKGVELESVKVYKTTTVAEVRND